MAKKKTTKKLYGVEFPLWFGPIGPTCPKKPSKTVLVSKPLESHLVDSDDLVREYKIPAGATHLEIKLNEIDCYSSCYGHCSSGEFHFAVQVEEVNKSYDAQLVQYEKEYAEYKAKKAEWEPYFEKYQEALAAERKKQARIRKEKVEKEQAVLREHRRKQYEKLKQEFESV